MRDTDAGSYGFRPIIRPQGAPRILRAVLRLENAERQASFFPADHQRDCYLRLVDLWAAERAEMDPEERELALMYGGPTPPLAPDSPAFVAELDGEP